MQTAIYTTMTRNRVLRLTGAKGWLITVNFAKVLYANEPADYYEVTRIKRKGHWLLDGEAYRP